MPVTSILVALGLLASLGTFGYRVYGRLQHLRLGQPAEPFGNWGERLKSVLVFVAGQARLFRFRDTGLAHFFIFWGFVLLVPTILQAILEGLIPGFVIPLFGTFGPLLLIQDLVTVAVILAVVYGLYYRLVARPDRYQGSHQGEGTLVLCFILIIMVTLLCGAGIRQNLGQSQVASGWQPMSALTGWIFAGLAQTRQQVSERICWWIHLGTVLVFLPLLPVGKHFHVVTSIFNVLLRNLAPRGRLAPALREDGSEGVGRIEQFTWRRMLDWYGCTECGRCQDVCPAYSSGAALSPKLLIMGLRAHLFERGRALGARRAAPAGKPAVLEQRLAGDVFADEVFWSCATCYACDEECPLFIEHVQPIVDVRRYLLFQQRADKTLTAALEGLRRYGNSFGKSDRQRAKWTAGLDFKIKDIRKQPAQTLWYVGDYASYSPALTEITQVTARVFQRAGLDFGLLYDAERNAGNDVRRVGEEGLFGLLLHKNRATIEKCACEEIVTTDPHTYNTLKNEYRWSGNGDERHTGTEARRHEGKASRVVPVYHYSELLDRAIADGRLALRRSLDYTVTYHDPCYLGRYNDIYEPPRRVIRALGCRLVEMPRHRDRALCCGAGGGRIWMEEGKVRERPSESRVREAARLPGVQYLVVACPKDLTMYRDAIKTAGLEGKLEVKDLAELADEASREECAATAVAESPAMAGAAAGGPRESPT